LAQVGIIAIVYLQVGRIKLLLNLQWIYVVQVAHVRNKKIRVQADKSFCLDEIFAGKEVVTL
jgi:hypothetical protein